MLTAVESNFRDHERDCGDHVVGIALHPQDWEELCVAEIWGLPVLACDDIEAGRLELLCESNGTLIPQVDTFEELRDRWTYHLEAPARQDARSRGSGGGPNRAESTTSPPL
jgi:hypothetical protein